MAFIQSIKKHYRTITLTSYLLPILFAVIVSLAHVVTFWEVTNPASWAIFLSIAVEIAVLSSIAASRLSNWAWFPFSIVTLIQIIGNVFFSYTNINVAGALFTNWVELFDPLFNWFGWNTDGSLIVHKRILATFSGAMIPLISITFFHFFIRTIRMGVSADENISELPVNVTVEKPHEIPVEPVEPLIVEPAVIESAELPMVEPPVIESVEPLIVEPSVIESTELPVVEEPKPTKAVQLSLFNDNRFIETGSKKLSDEIVTSEVTPEIINNDILIDEGEKKK